ncbi:PREDICTED: uncharacterized protein LOC104611891 [Nelumbo nucifera]|uniref:DUF7054 domain-containing protein n=2 Tax=Nelumbo nucifera TaxID=4432 RepID=A0A822XFK4_NELNU|nr:PREDICTED: uncharacterized protein LOC104611891 [Nelumbo nucifera]DAD18682.1 TPA_asm: hypothetical protein HUJ06_020145 [Nelumbo nucifera]
MFSFLHLASTAYSLPKSASFHGRLPKGSGNLAPMKRLESNPEFLQGRGGHLLSVIGKPVSTDNVGQRLTKLLLNVTIQGRLGTIHVVMSLDNTVEDLTENVLRIYLREKRRPLLPETDPRRFGLHYSQFSLERLNPKEKLSNLGSRNFFLCPKADISVNSLCSDQAKKTTVPSFPCTAFMDFVL